MLHRSVILPAASRIDTLDAVGRAGGDRHNAVDRGTCFAGIGLFGLEQCTGQQQAAVEQLPLGADFGSLVALGPQNLRRKLVRIEADAAIVGGGSIQLRAERIGRGRVSCIDAGDGQRLITMPALLVHQAKIDRADARCVVMRADVVVVITNAAVQDDKIPIVGGVDRINTLGR